MFFGDSYAFFQGFLRSIEKPMEKRQQKCHSLSMLHCEKNVTWTQKMHQTGGKHHKQKQCL